MTHFRRVFGSVLSELTDAYARGKAEYVAPPKREEVRR